MILSPSLSLLFVAAVAVLSLLYNLRLRHRRRWQENLMDDFDTIP